MSKKRKSSKKKTHKGRNKSKHIKSLHVYYGLRNQGATCYLNSILQVLFMTKEFRENLLSKEVPDPKDVDSQLRELFGTLKEKEADTVGITAPMGIRNVFEQRDAAEYFEKILNKVHTDFSKIFNGSLRHTSFCSKGHETNSEVCQFWTLPLSMKESSGTTYSVEEGFKGFFKPSVVDDDNLMYCDECETKTGGTNACELVSEPLILTLQLKRFEFDYRLMSYVKINREVEIPPSLKTGKYKYELYAMVDHSGSLRGGHYTARIKSYEDQEWHSFNDTNIRHLNLPQFDRSQNACLLMYRKGTRTRGSTTLTHALMQLYYLFILLIMFSFLIFICLIPYVD